jgi:hypothetical protein
MFEQTAVRLLANSWSAPMKSPFPGMDPYLEEHWRDVHHNLVTFIQGDLNERMPSDLRARVEERVFVESAQAIECSVYPDVRVIERSQLPSEPNPPLDPDDAAWAHALLVRMGHAQIIGPDS